MENWFVLRQLDSAIRYNPHFTRWLGLSRAKRWGDFCRANISGFAANISLGMMLGLTPAVAAFFGLGLEVLHLPAFWWAVAMLPFNGALNVLVSFYLAFRMALRAQNINGVERSRIYAAIRQRLRARPSSFFLP